MHNNKRFLCSPVSSFDFIVVVLFCFVFVLLQTLLARSKFLFSDKRPLSLACFFSLRNAETHGRK